MSRYKLIKKYPGSPETLGLEIHTNGPFWQSNFMFYNVEHFHKPLIEFNPELYPGFWEKVVEKDYEILSFKPTEKHPGTVNQLIMLQSNNLYKYQHDWSITGCTLDELLLSVTKGFNTIHSVKRLSDGEVFTVGDKVRYNHNKNSVVKTILKISFEKIGCCPEKLFIYTDGEQSTINNYVKVDEPLFTTVDGVDIFVGDVFSFIAGDCRSYTKKATNLDKNRFSGNTFSTIEAAEEHFIMNKPCLSIKDLMSNFQLAAVNQYDEFDFFNKICLGKLKKLVKEKLK